MRQKYKKISTIIKLIEADSAKFENAVYEIRAFQSTLDEKDSIPNYIKIAYQKYHGKQMSWKTNNSANM